MTKPYLRPVAFSFLPDFVGVDDVLPEDITAGTDGGEGVEEGVGHPDGESGVLLTKGLACLNDTMEGTAYELAEGELEKTEQKSEECDGQEKQYSGLGMDDILDGGAGDDEKGGCPEIIGEVAHRDNPEMETMEGGGVLDDECKEHGQKQHQSDLIENGQEGWEKSEMGTGFEQGEAEGDEEDGNDIGKKSVGGGLDQRASKFLGDDGGSGGPWGYDTHEDGLDKNEDIALESEQEGEGHEQENEEDIGEGDPPVPCHRAEGPEIDLAESDEEDEEHEQGHDGIADGREEMGGTVEDGHKCKDEIDSGTHGHGQGQRPVFDKAQQSRGFHLSVHFFGVQKYKIILRFQKKTLSLHAIRPFLLTKNQTEVWITRLLTLRA